MIHFAEEKSPFYDKHKLFCQMIENFSISVGGKTSGFCNSYGYEVLLEFEKDSIPYKIEFIKRQSTQNGVIIPVDSLEYYGFVFKSKTPISDLEIDYGKSKSKRLVTRKEFKKLVPLGQYCFIKSNLRKEINIQIVKQISLIGSDALHLKNDNLKITRHLNKHEPQIAIDELIELTNKLIEIVRCQNDPNKIPHLQSKQRN